MSSPLGAPMRDRVRTSELPPPDAELLRALHEEHAPALWRFVTRLLDGDRVRAQDVVQETFLRAWRHPQVLDQTAGSARGWLFTVARNLVVDDWRRGSRRGEVLTGTPVDVVDVAVPAADAGVAERQLLLAALATLSHEHREAVVECYLRGVPVREVSERLGIPPGTVKSRCHYALRALREVLDRQEGAR